MRGCEVLVVRFLRAIFFWYEATPDEIERVARALGERTSDSTPFGNRVEQAMARTETQAATLLTHVSVMIAVTGIFLAVEENGSAYRLILSLELTGYLFLAMLALRCLLRCETSAYFLSESEVGPAVQNRNNVAFDRFIKRKVGEIYFRDWLIRLSVFSIYGLTLILIVTIVSGTFL